MNDDRIYYLELIDPTMEPAPTRFIICQHCGALVVADKREAHLAQHISAVFG
jgi:hypothetical protein